MANRSKKQEFSKRILHQTMLIFVSQLIAALVFGWFAKDTSIFMYTIPSTAGIFGAAIIFYLNKAKIENVFKGKVDFLKLKLEMMKDCPVEHKEEIESELSEIDESLNSKIKTTMDEAVQENINIQQY